MFVTIIKLYDSGLELIERRSDPSADYQNTILIRPWLMADPVSLSHETADNGFENFKFFL